ncbi:MAG: cyclic nucleotide-binding domain-containing protein [Chloroflexota bacterium]
MAEVTPLLKKIHLFIAMTDEELKRLAPQFEEVSFKAGEVVFNQGDVADAFYVIQSGKVDVIAIASLTGDRRKLATLVPGDYFGERGVVKGGARSATIQAVTDVTLFKLSRDHFHTFIGRNPRIKPHLQVALQSRNYARSANFKWLREEEVVYLVTLRHRIFLLQMLAIPSAVMSGMVLVMALMLFLKLPAPWLVAPGILALADLAWLRWNWADFHNDWYVVTNQRVVDIDKIALIYDSRAEAPIQSVVNTAIKTTEWGRQLSYGDVIVNTFSGPITFHDVPNPQATADMVLEQVNRSRGQQRGMDRDALKNSVRQAMGLPVSAPPKKAEEKKEEPKRRGALDSLLKSIDIKVREQKGDTIIYHKHVYVLLLNVGAPLAGFLAVIIIAVLRVFNVFPFPNLLITSLVALALLLILGVATWYQYEDWKNDVYMVTNTQIFDIEHKPFGAEQRRAANLDAVQIVSFVRPSFIANLLNYGTVTVNAGPGGEMKFFDVFDPLGVQQDIYRRREVLNTNKSIAAAKQRHEEIGTYMSVFYEIMEEERKKREGNK